MKAANSRRTRVVAIRCTNLWVMNSTIVRYAKQRDAVGHQTWFTGLVPSTRYASSGAAELTKVGRCLGVNSV